MAFNITLFENITLLSFPVNLDFFSAGFLLGVVGACSCTLLGEDVGFFPICKILKFY